MQCQGVTGSGSNSFATSAKENPGELAGSTGAHSNDQQITSEVYCQRSRNATDLACAIAACAPEDAAILCAAFLEDVQTDGPGLGDPFGGLREDAEFWADCALPHELGAYAVSALTRLRGLPMAMAARKRLFVALWDGFPQDVRAAFLDRIDPKGEFRRVAQ